MDCMVESGVKGTPSEVGYFSWKGDSGSPVFTPWTTVIDYFLQHDNVHALGTLSWCWIPMFANYCDYDYDGYQDYFYVPISYTISDLGIKTIAGCG